MAPNRAGIRHVPVQILALPQSGWLNILKVTVQILYEMCFNLKDFWLGSLLHSMILNSNIKNIG